MRQYAKNFIKNTCVIIMFLSICSLSYANMCPEVGAAKQAWLESVDQWKALTQSMHPEENLSDAGLDSVEDFMGDVIDAVPDFIGISHAGLSG